MEKEAGDRMIKTEFSRKYGIPMNIVREASMFLENGRYFDEFDMIDKVRKILIRRIKSTEEIIDSNNKMLVRMSAKRANDNQGAVHAEH